MHEKPVRSALLPNTGVSDLCFCSFSVLRLLGKMHGDRGPRQCASPRDLQVLACGQASAGYFREKFLLHSVVIFLPAVIRKRSQIIEDEPALLRVKLRRRIRVSGTPRGAVVVDQFAKGSVVRGALLRSRACERQ